MKSTATIILILSTTFLITTVKAQNNLDDAFKSSERPSKHNIRIQIDDNMGNETYIPISIIKGKKEGPVFTILAGVHGYEYPPIIAAQEIIQEIDPESVTGTLIIIPITNTAAFFGRTPFVNPQDQVNLNRAFPGNENGSITKKIASYLTKNIIPISDFFLDMHGGDANEDLLPYVCYYNNDQKPKQTQQAKRLSEVSGFKYVVSYPYTLKENAPAKYAFKQAVQDGKTALSIECGKLGNVQRNAVDLIKMAVRNMFDELKMYPNPPKPKTDIVRINNQAYIKAKEKGIYVSHLKSGDSVEKGQVVGHLKDEFGQVISEIKAPHSGIILYKLGTPPVNMNETIMCIGY